MNSKYKNIIDYTRQYKMENTYCGRKVGVAVIDTGVFPHNDIKANVIDFYDCISGRKNPYDNNGHGTHVSGIIAGSGFSSRGAFIGINPDAAIIGIK
ncbi:MAG: S8 family serine peptidase, partial [Lachnospiraceae bacterium]|nr:S8 family serine peptidase [Lachnospiraceae bacterium]